MTDLQEETFNFIFCGSKSNMHFFFFFVQPALGVSGVRSSVRVFICVHSLRLWLLTTPTFPSSPLIPHSPHFCTDESLVTIITACLLIHTRSRQLR